MVLSNISFSLINFLSASKNLSLELVATSYNFMIVICDTFNPCDFFPCHFNTMIKSFLKKHLFMPIISNILHIFTLSKFCKTKMPMKNPIVSSFTFLLIQSLAKQKDQGKPYCKVFC